MQHAVVAKARQLHVGADLERLRRHAPPDVQQQRVAHRLRDGRHHIRAARLRGPHQLAEYGAPRLLAQQLESLKRVAVALVERPAHVLVQLLRSTGHSGRGE
jgi:hypothetical protein